jgi:hypothetical protein
VDVAIAFSGGNEGADVGIVGGCAQATEAPEILFDLGHVSIDPSDRREVRQVSHDDDVTR